MGSPSRRNFTLTQNLIGGEFSSARVTTEYLDETELTPSSLDVFDHARPLGLSPGYSDKGRLSILAITDDQNCRLITFPKSGCKSGGLAVLQDKILCRAAGDLFAFDMGPLTMSLYSDLGLRIASAVDIQSSLSATGRKPLTFIRKLVGDSAPIMPDNVETAFREPTFDFGNRHHPYELAARAWVAYFLATFQNGQEVFDKVPRINTRDMNDLQIQMIAKLSLDALKLDNRKPTQVVHSVQVSNDPITDISQVQSQSYNNRVRRNMNIRVEVQNGPINYRVHGGVGGSRGRKNIIETSRPLRGAAIATVTTYGREDPTSAEALRAATILRILQGAHDELNDNSWIKNIWFPQDNGLTTWPEDWSPPRKPMPKTKTSSSLNPSQLGQPQVLLNPSQQRAVNTMLSTSDSNHIVLVQGPPGTGKTSVIAAFVQLSLKLGKKGIWLIAQSNVAVKNIAEKLMKEKFFDWKLLVSFDFHFEWHEHLYPGVRKNLIRSDRFKKARSELENTSVILCTLSMLSHHDIGPVFTRVVPMNTLVVDEASQIEVGNYLTTFTKFGASLRKVCFIGDNKQLPPHGQEDNEDLQSVFELPHLNTPDKVIFLDTQYRMPPQIGQFISTAVYEDKLKSNPLHPIKDDVIACRFIDAKGGESKSGDSYQNPLECDICIKLAAKLQELDKSYRIITPYTAQRQLIEDSMKEDPGLLWGDKCFSVDSFQGNEDDYIIISIVRSLQIGFLRNLRRTNVMLTRCKKGMFIVSSRKFLGGPGASSLVGQMAESAGEAAWLDVAEIEAGEFLT